MGSKIHRAWHGYLARNERRLLLVGLDNAGKTTVLHQLHLGEAKETVPTVNYDVQTITHRKLKMHVWDVGGQDSLRPFWRHYLTGTQGILYVVDSSDSGRLELARKELQALLVDAQLDGVPLVVLANKQDADGAQSPEGVTKALDLATLAEGRSFSVVGSVAKSGTGLTEALDFLSEHMKPL